MERTNSSKLAWIRIMSRVAAWPPAAEAAAGSDVR